MNIARTALVVSILCGAASVASAEVGIALRNLEPKTLDLRSLTNDERPKELSDLPITEAKTQLFRVSAEGKSVFPLFGKVGGSKDDLIFIQDLAVYKLIKSSTEEKRVGVLMRIRATFKVIKGDADINIASVASLAANINNIQGNVQFISYGITGKGVLTQVPLPGAGITESSLLECLQALNLIRGKIGDSDTIVVPIELPPDFSLAQK